MLAIIAATAKNMNTLIGANVLLGLPAGVHTCYGLTVGEVVPNKWKFVGIAIAALSNVIPNGFGAYLGMSYSPVPRVIDQRPIVRPQARPLLQLEVGPVPTS